jgi:hypothetical protein
VFDVLNPWQRVLLMVGGGFVFWLLYMLGDLLNNMLWGMFIVFHSNLLDIFRGRFARCEHGGQKDQMNELLDDRN